MIYALCIVSGFVLACLLSRARWAVFPLSGGPRWSGSGSPVLGFLGQPLSAPRHRHDFCETCGRCRGCFPYDPDHEPESGVVN